MNKSKIDMSKVAMRPWNVKIHPEFGRYIMSQSAYVCPNPLHQNFPDDNLAFIIHAVNLHDRLVEALEKAEIEIDRLVEALEDVLPYLPNVKQFDEGDPDPAGKIERLLAEAKGDSDEN